jgi:hypothetical protein
MKKSFIILSMLLMGITINLSAQYTSIKLTAAKDTIHLGEWRQWYYNKSFDLQL